MPEWLVSITLEGLVDKNGFRHPCFDERRQPLCALVYAITIRKTMPVVLNRLAISVAVRPAPADKPRKDYRFRQGLKVRHKRRSGSDGKSR
jgi:hypothetical protein